MQEARATKGGLQGYFQENQKIPPINQKINRQNLTELIRNLHCNWHQTSVRMQNKILHKTFTFQIFWYGQYYPFSKK